MSKMVELTRYSSFNDAAAGKVEINPEAVEAIEEVIPPRGLETRARVHLRTGVTIEIYEGYEFAKSRLGL